MTSRTAIDVAVAHAEKVEKSMLRALATASARGKTAEARRVQHAIFRSREVQLACAAQVWKRFGRPTRSEAIFPLARRVNCRAPCLETVVFRDVRKRSGAGLRRTCSFGLEHTTRFLMVAKVLRATFHPPEWQFEHRGKGRDKAVAQVAYHIAAGNSHAAVMDIKNCYNSFDEGRVSHLLPLPLKVAQNVVFMGGLILRDGNVLPGAIPLHHQAPQLQPAGCLPQGSVASPLVASLLLSDLDEMISSRCHLIGFADDLVVLGRTKADVDESAQSLQAALLEHRSGRLELKGLISVSAEEGFDFLGYKIAAHEGAVSISPSQHNLDRIDAAFWSIFQNEGEMAQERVTALERKIRGFPSWTDRQQHIEHLIDLAQSHEQMRLLTDLMFGGALQLPPN